MITALWTVALIAAASSVGLHGCRWGTDGSPRRAERSTHMLLMSVFLATEIGILSLSTTVTEDPRAVALSVGGVLLGVAGLIVHATSGEKTPATRSTSSEENRG